MLVRNGAGRVQTENPSTAQYRMHECGRRQDDVAVAETLDRCLQFQVTSQTNWRCYVG